MALWGSKEIKTQVSAILQRQASKLQGMMVIDVPAGSGYSSAILRQLGAQVQPLDLFPEFFKTQGLVCKKADLSQRLPIESASCDMVLCQEGIEHLPDQLFPLREFNRVLKGGGRLIITTPNYSNMRSRLSYFLNESEYYKYMAPNEIEQIWLNDASSEDIYFGHIFNIGLQKLRLLATVAGFEIVKVHSSTWSGSSVVLCVLFYPFILLAHLRAYIRAFLKNKAVSRDYKKSVFNEQMRYGLSWNVLCGGHLIVEFKKVAEVSQVKQGLISKIQSFSQNT